ncbi:hypothetical protein LQ327_03050 [Actinomycetospora endophytica]|uniref:N-formylglutamate amidohydrolase n=1 Tax=Actinomycetospora endophytica TaxID=2291215 RepID=A0ABS8P2B5_9PSEU|nr:hypothetical protein [Actinomycetospora endophytica]MCD2192375.1 hypothetical protein [Actinomycetospora endophytica]
MAGRGGDETLAAVVHRLTTALLLDGPYRPPGADEDAVVEEFVAAVVTACTTGPTPALAAAGAAVGFATSRHGARMLLTTDPREPRAWGLVVLPAVVGTRNPDVVVEIPHPHFDLRTEAVGVGILDRIDGALLLQAGAHRHAAAPAWARRRVDFPADVSHRPDSVFARLAAGIVAARGTPQVQVHGCADREGFDVVASSGAAAPSALLDDVTSGLRAAGERVRGGGDPGCERLSGIRNVQGRLAARLGTPFVHLELSRSLRRDPARREAVARVVADAVVASRTRDGDVTTGT